MYKMKPKKAAAGLSLAALMDSYADILPSEATGIAEDVAELLDEGPGDLIGKPEQPAGASKGNRTKRKHAPPDATPPAKALKKQQDASNTRKPERNQNRQDLQQQPKQKAAKAASPQPSGGKWPFQVDYLDHFETGPDALAHADLILTQLARCLGKPKNALVIYDPYYCQGSVVDHWKQLGYTHVINRNRDFYADVAAHQVPDHDVLVTNPPYSGDHKERILSYCLSSNKPWLLLMPNYVANKSYYSAALDKAGAEQDKQHKSGPGAQKQQGGSQNKWRPPFYLVPSIKYEYEHPEGTGHASSPFFSIWYVHLRQYTSRACEAVQASASKLGAAGAVRVITSVEGLRQGGAAPAHKRPNPRQRKKLKAMVGQK